MTPVTFIDFNVFHACDLHGDHLEMLHIVAWGRLMTLRAIERSLGRVPVARNDPLLGDMTLAAVIPEQSGVPVLCSVASVAVQSFTETIPRPALTANPGFNALCCSPVLGIRHRRLELVEANSRERRVIHDNGPDADALVLGMTFRALADIGVKRCRLPLQQVLVVRMADNTIGRLNAPSWSVTSGALFFEERVSRGEVARTREALQPGEICGYVHTKGGESRGGHNQRQ